MCRLSSVCLHNLSGWLLTWIHLDDCNIYSSTLHVQNRTYARLTEISCTNTCENKAINKCIWKRGVPPKEWWLRPWRLRPKCSCSGSLCVRWKNSLSHEISDPKPNHLWVQWANLQWMPTFSFGVIPTYRNCPASLMQRTQGLLPLYAGEMKSKWHFR